MAEREGMAMRGFALGAIVAACIVVMSGCTSERYTTRHREAPKDSVATMTTKDVVALSKAGIGPEVIIKMISTSGSTFQLHTPDVIALADSGVVDTVIHAMLSAEGPAGEGSRTRVVHVVPSDAYWRYGPPYYYDPWYYGRPGPYFGARFYGGFRGHHRW
jgi:hypothetical protein